MNKPVTVLFFAALAVAGWFFFYPRFKHTHAIDTLIVGTNAEFAPFTFYKDGVLTGFDIEVATLVAQRLGKKVEFKDVAFETLIPAVQLGTFHMLAAGITPTKTRANHVHFTSPIFDGDNLVVITLKSTESINTPADLKNKRILVNEGYTSDLYLSAHPEIVPEANITRLAAASVSEGILALESNRGDAFIAADSSIAPFMNGNKKDQFKVFVLPNAQESDALAVSKKFPALFEQIEKTVQELSTDGSLAALQKKWFPA